MPKKIDYIIVGQGIAGTTLAYTLLKNNHKILVIDSQNPQSSSRVAAGLFNPITGKRMLKTWQADVLFPFFFDFYQELEAVLQASFFHPLPMYRPFHSVHQQNAWLTESAETENLAYISSQQVPESLQKQINAPLGGLVLQKTGYLNLSVLLSHFRQFLQEKEAFSGNVLEDTEVSFENDKVRWQDYEAKKIIFCRGFEDSKSVFFQDLPFAPTRGEILDLTLPIDFQWIVNKKCWVIPLGEGKHWVGSSYDKKVLNTTPTEWGKRSILERFEKLTTLKFEVLNHRAAVRPTTADRRLLVGINPDYQQVTIFNGLGTKGVSQAPYFAQQFYEFLEHGKPLLPEIDIQRYQKS